MFIKTYGDLDETYIDLDERKKLKHVDFASKSDLRGILNGIFIWVFFE
jgi:hypothetical protein